MTESVGTWAATPNWIKEIVNPVLDPGEAPVTWFEPDLDSSLQFSSSLLVLTNHRLLQFPGDAVALTDGLELIATDLAGASRLELLDQGQLLSVWRYTASRGPAARRLVEEFEAARKGAPPKPPETGMLPSVKAECPVCGATILGTINSCPECGASLAQTPVRSLLRLFSVARKYLKMSVLGFFLTLACTATGLIPPYLTMPLIDKILIPFQEGRTVDTSMVKWYLIGLAGASVLAWALTWAQMFVLSWVSERVSADLRNMTYAHLQRLSLEYFGRKRTGDLISRVSSDTDRICYFLSVYVLDFVTDVIMLFMTAAILLTTDVGLAVVTLLPLPFISLAVFKVQSRMSHGFTKGNRAWAELTSILADTIPGIRVVKAFAQEDREIKRFTDANAHVLRTNDRVNAIWAYFSAVVVLLTDLGVLIVWLFGVYRVFHHSVTVGVLQAFVVLISRFYARLDSMSRIVSATQRAASSAQRVFGILDRTPKVPETKDPVPVGRLKGAIELRDVNFRYGARPILKNVSLSIGAGEMVGLVGQSGAGKTTLINLLCRFYDVTDGSILVDGTDIRRFRVGEFRRNVGLVLQEPFLFYGTIAENIAYGRPEATREEILAAARAARAHEFILRLPNGYDSLVGERGQFLSGGERQRISIARALLIDPRILILDEATSSVDNETEREIQLALANLIKGRTTIAIAHRLSTLQRADRLVVMERGEIVEMGAHDELLAKEGVYARLHNAQDEPVEAVEEEDDE